MLSCSPGASLAVLEDPHLQDGISEVPGLSGSSGCGHLGGGKELTGGGVAGELERKWRS